MKLVCTTNSFFFFFWGGRLLIFFPADLEADWESVDPKDVEYTRGIHQEDVEIFEREIASKETVRLFFHAFLADNEHR